MQVGERLRLHLNVRSSLHELDQPRHCLRRIAEADRKRPKRIEQPTRHLLPYTRQRHRHHAVRPDRAGIAEAGDRAGRLWVDQGNVVSVALQKGGRADADNAGADNSRAGQRLLRHERFFRS